jgi:porphobilinogen synthase
LLRSDLIAPLFVAEGLQAPVEISSMPGQFQHNVDSLVATVDDLIQNGITAITLFGIPEVKDAVGSQGSDEHGIVQVALRRLRAEFGDAVVLMPDLCLDEFIEHGHCGVLNAHGDVDNDATLVRYAEMAIAQAAAGADLVAPSGMMDGQVHAIRQALDAAGFQDTGILAYAAKYHSGLFGPFRNAVDVTIAGGGNRKTYQQDWANRRESLREVALDIAEGADIVMVKPALTYLDVISDVAENFDVPVAAYHVSGEYAMVKAAAERGWIDGDAVALEQLTAVKRAGADMILTYFAREIAGMLND